MAAPRQAAPLDRFLRLFADVRSGEATTALLLTANVFLILMAYYIIKPLRDGLVISEQSAEIKSYLSAAQVVLLAAVLPAYGWLADRFPRRRLINLVTWIFAGCLVAFYLLGSAGVPIGVPFFIWAGMFNVMVVAQFWSFANDVYTRKEGERLFPIVAFGASSGAVVGVVFVSGMVGGFGLYVPMLLAAAVLLLEVQITNYVDARERRARESHLPDVRTTASVAATGTIPKMRTIEELEAAAEREREAFEARERGETVEEYDGPASGLGAFQLVFRTRYLLLICLLVMMLNWVNTNGEYILGRAVEEVASARVASGEAGGLTEGQIISGFFASFYGGVNVLGLFIQLFLVSRIVKLVGVRWGIRILPLISLGAFSLIAFVPILAAIRWAKTFENATDYSLNNTVRAMLFLPTTREQKYKAKQVADSLFHRAGDVLSSLTVFVGAALLSLSTTSFALVNIALVGIWMVVAFAIGRSYDELVASGRPPQPTGTGRPRQFEPGETL